MKKCLVICLLFVQHQAWAQIANASFENWTYQEATEFWTLDGWLHCFSNGEVKEDPYLFGTYRDSMAKFGQYALTLSRWYGVDLDIARYRGAISSKPVELNGFYKYTDAALQNGKTDTAQIAVYMTRYNNLFQSNDTIGTGVINLQTSDDFMAFACYITYKPNTNTPDSFIIDIIPSHLNPAGSGLCASGNRCSYLTVDNLNLSVSVNAPEPDPNPIGIYPNPASGQTLVVGRLEGKTLSLRNQFGQVLHQERAISDQCTLELGYLPAGVYYLFVNGIVKTIVRQ